jgi:hypothetical protein
MESDGNPFLIPDDETWRPGQGHATGKGIAKWRERTQLLAVTGHKLTLENGQKIQGEGFCAASDACWKGHGRYRFAL